ncbi:acyltransferase family protein [Spirosoma sp. KNUC1025]|uniref:acyltransferase family protein n=1 Tax=Spirosoma sp. KNUC1025 TaxID=2894082 RepID=UPI001E60EADA|nr:acyltransferase family protein [Spirosoma sp. KNUC1025]UFH57658.1 acyltransferase family protein [Spirosoma sp. KNUC1025]
MMLLGIVIHTSTTYSSTDYGPVWPIKSPDNQLIYGVLVDVLHCFRMPVFFVTAGYLGALLLTKKGPKAMLSNRVKRILLPFLVGVLLVHPLWMTAFQFTGLAFAAAPAPLTDTVNGLCSATFLPHNVGHLWFLEYLMGCSLLSWLLARLIKRDTVFTLTFMRETDYVLRNPGLRLLLLTLLIFGCFCGMGVAHIPTKLTWLIAPDVFVTYFCFYGLGWMIYQTNTLAKLTVYPISQLVVAAMLFLVARLAPWPQLTGVHYVQMVFAALSSALFVFGFIAFFQKYFHQYSLPLTYLMESSYWVYIIHLPIVVLVPGLLAKVALPTIVKFSLTLLVTALTALLSYHYLVRNTAVDLFLNGNVPTRSPVLNTHHPAHPIGSKPASDRFL